MSQFFARANVTWGTWGTGGTNGSTERDHCGYSTLDQPSVRAIFIAAYLIVFICCCSGNFLLLIVVGAHPAMRTVTNFFLANLGAADVLVAFFCVIQNLMHLFIFEQALWPLGSFMCQMYVFIVHLIPCTSAGLLLVLSCERYIAVRHPIAARSLLTKDRLAITTGVVWVVSVITNVPYFMVADYQQYTELVNGSSITLAWCGRAYRVVDEKTMITFSFVVWYVVPFLAMLVIYSIIGCSLWRSAGASSGLTRRSGGLARRHSSGATSNATFRIDSPRVERSLEMELACVNSRANRSWRRQNSEDQISRLTADSANRKWHRAGEAKDAIESRKRVIRLLVSIVLAFAVLTLPNHVRLLLNAWSPPRRRCNHGFHAILQPLSYLLLFSNSGINPILYAFMSNKFRLAVREIFQRKGLREQRRERVLTSMRSTDNGTLTECC